MTLTLESASNTTRRSLDRSSDRDPMVHAALPPGLFD